MLPLPSVSLPLALEANFNLQAERQDNSSHLSIPAKCTLLSTFKVNFSQRRIWLEAASAAIFFSHPQQSGAEQGNQEKEMCSWCSCLPCSALLCHLVLNFIMAKPGETGKEACGDEVGWHWLQSWQERERERDSILTDITNWNLWKKKTQDYSHNNHNKEAWFSEFKKQAKIIRHHSHQPWQILNHFLKDDSFFLL